MMIVVLLINLRGFPYTFSAVSFINPSTVGSFVRLLFSRLRKFREEYLLATLSESYPIWLLLTSMI